MVLPALGVAITGTSLVTGRLSADVVPRLAQEAPTLPECLGPVVIFNEGRGGWTSANILANVPVIVSLQPAVVFIDTGSINDCFDSGSGPQVSLVDHDANLTSIINDLRSGIPGVDLTVMTMSPGSTSIAAGRPQLATYYAHDLSVAAGLSVRTMDNYAGWVKPLPDALTYDLDGLHPIWAGADDTYFYPNLKAGLQARMGDFWS